MGELYMVYRRCKEFIKNSFYTRKPFKTLLLVFCFRIYLNFLRYIHCFLKGYHMKVLVIGGATQDLFVNYQGTALMRITKKDCVAEYALFESGEKCEVATLFAQTGGGNTNAAVSFKQQNADVTCFCMVGSDTIGNEIINSLTQAGIGTSLIKRSPDLPSGQSIIINATSGERTIFAFRGANNYLPLETLTSNDLNGIDHIYITSLSNDSSLKLPSFTQLARANNIPIAINPGKSQLSKGMLTLKASLNNIDTLILNSNEAQLFMHALIESDNSYKEALESAAQQKPCGINMQSKEPYLITSAIAWQDQHFSMHKFFKTVLHMGPSIVVVTNGRNGVYVANNDEIFFHPSLPINVINSVGAGDAFGSTFVASLATGNTIQDALRLGIINSASVLQEVGAKTGLLSCKQLLEQLHTLDKKLLQCFPIKRKSN